MVAVEAEQGVKKDIDGNYDEERKFPVALKEISILGAAYRSHNR
jgi:hypothetical protein